MLGKQKVISAINIILKSAGGAFLDTSISERSLPLQKSFSIYSPFPRSQPIQDHESDNEIYLHTYVVGMNFNLQS